MSSSCSSNAGVTLRSRSRLGDAGGVSSLLLALLVCLDGEAGMLKLLLGRAKGLVGRSEVWLICDGRLTNGLAFSGDSEPTLVGDKLEEIAGLVGDCVGVVARTVTEDAVLFWRLKGDSRPESGEGL